MIKDTVAAATRSRPFAWFVALLERLDHEAPDLLRVLTYHRVSPVEADHPLPPGINVPPDAFAEQMRYLRTRCHVLSVEELIHDGRLRTLIPARSVAVTFDDGYRDFRSHAWPILRSLGLPVTLFVPTAFPGDPSRSFWWDQLHHALTSTARRDALDTPLGVIPLATERDRRFAYSRLRDRAKQMAHQQAIAWTASLCRELAVPPLPPAILSWDELRELAREGVVMGSHTRTHPLLTRIPIEQARAEVHDSMRDLERELGKAPPVLAYPAGAFDDRVVSMAAKEGVVLGFTTVRGSNPLATAHPLELRRINVGARTPLALMRAQLTGWAATLKI